MILYKYTKAEYGKEILKNKTVKASYASEFNDPYDCAIEATEEQKKRCYDLVINYLLFKEFSNSLNKNRKNLNSTSKMLSANAAALFDLTVMTMKKEHIFVPLPYLNNLLKLKKAKTIKEEINSAMPYFFQRIDELIDGIKKSILISSFSECNDSVLMWSHYADSHKGVCVEFDVIDDDRFCKVKYVSKRKTFDAYFFMQLALAEDYLGKTDISKDKKLLKRILEPFFTKSNDWEYEKEVRSINELSTNDKENSKSGTIHTFYPGQITKVYLGCKISDDERDIRELAKDIPVVKLKESIKNYKLVEEK